MDSSTFRKSYARLRDVTYVEANGHTIGVWVPAEAGLLIDIEHRGDGRDQHLGEHIGFGPEHPTVLRDRLGKPQQQAERDALLRKINRGG